MPCCLLGLLLYLPIYCKKRRSLPESIDWNPLANTNPPLFRFAGGFFLPSAVQYGCLSFAHRICIRIRATRSRIGATQSRNGFLRVFVVTLRTLSRELKQHSGYGYVQQILECAFTAARLSRFMSAAIGFLIQ